MTVQPAKRQKPVERRIGRGVIRDEIDLSRLRIDDRMAGEIHEQEGLPSHPLRKPAGQGLFNIEPVGQLILQQHDVVFRDAEFLLQRGGEPGWIGGRFGVRPRPGIAIKSKFGKRSYACRLLCYNFGQAREKQASFLPWKKNQMPPFPKKKRDS